MVRKVGTTGRFGPRYGMRTKKVVASIERMQKQKQSCPRCERLSLKRIATGIWLCKKCKLKIAGGSYMPQSTTIKVVKESQRK